MLAAVDCTGHGIPGAFMSMIGNICLKNIIKENPGIRANEVLNELHIQIHTLLKQGRTDNRDGMDIALVIIDEQQKQLEFAGAKNPLVYFQSGYSSKIKGDKMPIGSNWKRNQHDRHFANHFINLNAPTTIYLYSDGYQDQFGGENNEKFMIVQKHVIAGNQTSFLLRGSIVSRHNFITHKGMVMILGCEHSLDFQ